MAITIRKIESVYVVAPDGMANSPAEAIAFIEPFGDARADFTSTRYEVSVRYNNGDEVRGQFSDKFAASAFLRTVK